MKKRIQEIKPIAAQYAAIQKIIKKFNKKVLVRLKVAHIVCHLFNEKKIGVKFERFIN